VGLRPAAEWTFSDRVPREDAADARVGVRVRHGLVVQRRRRIAMRAGLGLAVLLITGCGLPSVVTDADAVVADWARDRSEVDPCRIDAMQHCVGASAAAAVCGRYCAVVLGDILEIQQSDGNAMDRANNAVGAGCGRAITGIADGAVACCELLLDADPPGLVTEGPCN
jgi:hypothetical protein